MAIFCPTGSNYQRAKTLLESQMDTLKRLAETLLEHEALDAAQIEAVIEGRPLPEPVPRPVPAPEAETAKDREKKDKPVFTPIPFKEDPEKA